MVKVASSLVTTGIWRHFCTHFISSYQLLEYLAA
ncbi:hypothetical protein E9S_03862 [Moraxella catarrhalis BC7]|nr:hypothetical protein E9U_04350 [Moraxella catarrhalis BC8]EGE20863.1 hypothetical protein E9S_03862 [Moraxella catarrhalis BC7]EGE25943.1 hypothetical protein E9W_03630 [Moraxella catarrhalis CO72]